MTTRAPTLAPTDGDGPSIERRHGSTRIRDGLAILAVPAVLLVAFLLPSSVKTSLVLSEPGSPASMFLAHFVHRAPAHLLGNLAGYLLVAGIAYRLSALAGRRSDFHVAFVAFLFAFPLVLSLLSRPFVENGVVFGFSGVFTAFLGFLPLAIVRYLGTRLDGVSIDHAPGLFFLGLAVVAWQGVPDPTIATPLAGLAGLAAALYFVPAASVSGARSLLRVRRIDLVIGAVAVFFVLLIAAFPSDPVRGRTVVNLYVHLLGYGLGFIASYLALRVEPAVESLWTCASA